MDREIKIPPDWNAEVQTNIDRFAFTFQTQSDFTIAKRIYERLLELRKLSIVAFEKNPSDAGKTYRLRAELDDLIISILFLKTFFIFDKSKNLEILCPPMLKILLK